MRMIYEVVDDEDFLEIILKDEDLGSLESLGIVNNFPGGLHPDRNLNLLIRLKNPYIREDQND